MTSATIHRLPESLVRKIAAGEVIERPASVVKELVENAVDAGTRRVRIDVVDGGRQGIRVVDDGSGMSREDVELSVERHATSKMRSPTDLFTIGTLGFRGEALASIGAVSRLTIVTRAAADDEGTRLVVEGGVRRELGPAAHDVGTAIDVQGLFFNTPARRKFLRHTDAEMRYVTQAVVQLAAAYPEVAFQLRHGERDSLDLLPGERRLRAAEVLNIDGDELLWVEAAVGGETGPDAVRVEGLITPPGHCRRARSKQYVVVRRRPVRSRTLANAVYSGYGSLLPHGAHPQYVLWIDLDPRHVDVNVHPTKREVRFAHEPRIRQAIQEGVRRALSMPEARAYSDPSTAVTPAGTATDEPTTRTEQERAATDRGRGYLSADGALSAGLGHDAADRTADASYFVADAPATPTAGPARERPPLEAGHDPGAEAGAAADEDLDLEPPQSQLRLELLPAVAPGGEVLGDDEAGRRLVLEARGGQDRAWQIHDKYLLMPIHDGLLVVDQHAAHERVRYEEVLDALAGETAASQQLLMPLTVEVSAVEMEVLRTNQALFEQLGFSVREFGPTTLLVDAVPPELRSWSEGDLFYQILSDLIDELEARSEARDAMAATMACHTSIRTGQHLAATERLTLIRRLLNAREPFACPHGRPILLRIPLSELDRLFHRT